MSDRHDGGLLASQNQHTRLHHQASENVRLQGGRGCSVAGALDRHICLPTSDSSAQWELPKTMRFHKSSSKDIEVDFLRFSRIKPHLT